jgi:hypothetical protein
MKRRNLIIITILAVIGLIISIYFMLSPLFKPIVGGDQDIHGCIGSAGYEWCEAKQQCIRPWEENCSSEEVQKIYCTPDQKSAQVCPEYYSATCGWFNQSIKCFKYPCAQTFDNPCFACSNPSVDYYTSGECPE